MKRFFCIVLCAMLLASCAAALAEDMAGQEVAFAADQTYDVYSAPDTVGVPRGGEDNAAVSTSDWILVYGEEDGWLLIEYAVSEEQHRFGYIPGEALPEDVAIPQVAWEPQPARLTHETTLTDDPLYSQSELLTLPEGAWVTALGTLEGWVYVESSTGDYVRGFARAEDLSYDMMFNLEDHAEGLATGTLTVTPEGHFMLEMSLCADASLPGAVALQNLEGAAIGEASLDPELGYLLEGDLPEGTSGILFFAGGEEPLFSVEW